MYYSKDYLSLVQEVFKVKVQLYLKPLEEQTLTDLRRVRDFAELVINKERALGNITIFPTAELYDTKDSKAQYQVELDKIFSPLKVIVELIELGNLNPSDMADIGQGSTTKYVTRRLGETAPNLIVSISKYMEEYLNFAMGEFISQTKGLNLEDNEDLAFLVRQLGAHILHYFKQSNQVELKQHLVNLDTFTSHLDDLGLAVYADLFREL